MKRPVCCANRREAGFTLIELIVTIVVMGIISGVAALLILQGLNAFIAEDVRASLTNDGRLAIERMAREIRTIRSRTAADIPTMLGGTLSFVDLDGNPITYTSGGGTVTRNGTPLASATTAALGFLYFQQDGTPAGSADQVWVIQVDLTLTTGGESQAFRIRAHPRNFS
jgi:prepilin-type N-terminal cleavage/methylation domain-containing protein